MPLLHAICPGFLWARDKKVAFIPGPTASRARGDRGILSRLVAPPGTKGPTLLSRLVLPTGTKGPST